MPAPIANSGIAAQAFRLMEMSPISSFGDDSEQAIAAAEQYPVALDMCLAHGDFSFASIPVWLSQVSEEPKDPRLPYAYHLPADLVKVQEVLPECAEWRVDEDRLRSDQAAPLWIRYSRRITDEARLSGLFRSAVAHQLAALLAPRWTTSLNRATAWAERAQDLLEQAAAADRNSASGRRYDGDDRHDDWTCEAVR